MKSLRDLRVLASFFASLTLAVSLAFADTADQIEAKLKKEASHIVVGKVQTISVTRATGMGKERLEAITATILVSEVEKGDAAQPGKTIRVKYSRRTGPNTQKFLDVPVHDPVPKESDNVRIYLTNSLKVLQPNGFVLHPNSPNKVVKAKPVNQNRRRDQVRVASKPDNGENDNNQEEVSTPKTPIQDFPTRGGWKPGDEVRIKGTVRTLAGWKLRLVGNDSVRWEFEESKVSISSADGRLPDGLSKEFQLDTAPFKISASWELIRQNRQLRLYDLTVDGEAFDSELLFLVKKAGTIRINIGSGQYNSVPPKPDGD